ncbi:MAG: hypothetical protein R3C17_00060 [Planctomycetaceae bacterium]
MLTKRILGNYNFGHGQMPLLSRRRFHAIINCKDAVEIHAEPEAEIAGSLRSRPPEWFGFELLRVVFAIILDASSNGIGGRFDCAA